MNKCEYWKTAHTAVGEEETPDVDRNRKMEIEKALCGAQQLSEERDEETSIDRQ